MVAWFNPCIDLLNIFYFNIYNSNTLTKDAYRDTSSRDNVYFILFIDQLIQIVNKYFQVQVYKSLRNYNLYMLIKVSPHFISVKTIYNIWWL